MASLHVIGCRAFISIINHDRPTLSPHAQY